MTGRQSCHIILSQILVLSDQNCQNMSKVIKSWQMRSNLVKVRDQTENPLKHEDIKPKRTSRMAEGAHVGEQQVLLGGESHRHYSG